LLTESPLNPTDPNSAVRAELLEDEGEERYVIKDIIGLASEKDLGVENLKVCRAIIQHSSLHKRLKPARGMPWPQRLSRLL
jgi:hypothetical protein